MSEDGGAERITVNLSKRGAWALNLICSQTEEGKTDAVNSALRLYATVLGVSPDVHLYVKARSGAPMERIHLP